MTTDLIPPTPFEFIALTSTLSSCCGSLSSLQCSPLPSPPFLFSSLLCFLPQLSSLLSTASFHLLSWKSGNFSFWVFLWNPFFWFFAIVMRHACLHVWYMYALGVWNVVYVDIVASLFLALECSNLQRFFWRDKRLLSWKKKEVTMGGWGLTGEDLMEGGKRDIGPVQSKTRSQCLHRACDFDWAVPISRTTRPQVL